MNISDLRKKAAAGNVVAESMLGICYLDGIDVGVDYQEALRFLSSAAEKGAARAIVHLARMHAEGLGIPKNMPEAIRLYEKSAVAGEFLAQIQLARIYVRGD